MLPLWIALRYLVSPKSHNAINAITLVAGVGVGIITAAMICVLSVYNGFEGLVRSLTSQIDPDLRVEATEGRFFHDSDSLRQFFLSHPDVTSLAPILSETVLLTYGGQQLPATAWAVDTLLEQHCIPGVGIAARLGMFNGAVRPLTLYLPIRNTKISLTDPESNFHKQTFYVADLLRINQAEYDDRLILVPLHQMQELMEDSLLLSAYDLRLRPGADKQRVRSELTASWPTSYPLHIRTAEDLQAGIYRIMRLEKWITYLMVLFILLIASFNLIGALSMLMIDKQAQSDTLIHLGAPPSLIGRIFFCEGIIITLLGATIGLLVGVCLTLLQQHFGFIGLGDGSSIYVVDAYPVALHASDVLVTFLTVCGLGLLATLYPLRR